MPIIVGCPKCAGQLRVADDLIGRRVRCPACGVTFDAAEPAPSASPAAEPRPLPDLELPAPTERIDPWKSLNLELTPDEPAKPPKETPPSKDVREIAPTPEQDEPRKPRKPRLGDDHDDLRPCPGCGRMVHRNSKRCVSCGERLRVGHREDEDEDYPEDDIRYHRRRPRRDWEPHRAGFVLTMGIISLATPFTCWLLAWLAIVPGIMAWVMGSGDLRKMRNGAMDPEGHGSTQAGWICGIVGTLINTLVVLGCGAILGLIWFGEVQQSKTRQCAPFNAPPPPKMVAPPG